jgi:hypothetical protein
MKVILLVALAACLFVATMAEIGKDVALTSTPITSTVPSSSAGKLENAGKIADKGIGMNETVRVLLDLTKNNFKLFFYSFKRKSSWRFKKCRKQN